MIPQTILLLGGTAEAYALAERLVREKFARRVRILTSLSGATKTPRLPAGEVRFGGFGGPEGLADFLRQENVSLLVDATHPFAEQISRNAALASAATEIPLLRLERPPWVPEPEDRWISVLNLAAATAWLREHPHTVFLTTGIRELDAFQDCPGSRFVIRTITPPQLAEPWPQATFVQARGPFSVEAELQLLRDHNITLLVTKNSGGTATIPKLHAARQLGLPVLMIERPELPPVETVPDVASAMQWCLALRHEA